MKQSDLQQIVDALKPIFVTKDDLSSMEARQDLKYTTNADLIAMEDRLNEKFVSKDDFNEKIRLLPTRDEFFDCMDTLSGEYKKIDQAETLHTGQISEHSDELEAHDQRIKVLETRQKPSPTPLATSIS